jgi:hypothetical protein
MNCTTKGYKLIKEARKSIPNLSYTYIPIYETRGWKLRKEKIKERSGTNQ